MSADPKTPTVLFVVSEDWYFVSHRLPQARAVRDLGCHVVVATRVGDAGHAIRSEGFTLAALPMERGSFNPFKEARTVWAIYRLLARHRPAVVHAVALKPILDAGLAAVFRRKVVVINAFTGMGAILGAGTARRHPLTRVLAGGVRVLSRLNRAYAIVQNSDDRAFVIEGGVAPADRVVLIPGSGVDVSVFAPAPEPAGPVTVLMVSRLLRDKGVGELVEAARLLRARGLSLRVWIVGDRDPDNPNSVSDGEIAGWTAAGDVTFLGRRSDIAQLWRQAHIATLPSYYGEGVPKSLLEAAASGRPIVTTDMPGCRDLVPDGRTGELVAPRDAAGLADALARLSQDPARRHAMGAGARRLAVDMFAEARIAGDTQRLYRSLLVL